MARYVLPYMEQPNANLRIEQGATDPTGEGAYRSVVRCEFTFRAASTHCELSILLGQLACCITAAN